MALHCPPGSQVFVGKSRWTQDTEHVRAKKIGNASTVTASLRHTNTRTSSLPLLPSRRHIFHRSIRANAAISTVQAPSDEEVRQLLDAVKLKLATQHGDLPCGPQGRDDEEMLLWFLRDRKFKVDPTVEKLSAAIKWRHSFGVAGLTADDVAAEAATGKAYLHEHFDADGRPVIVVEAAKHFPDSARLTKSQQLCAYLIERAIEQLPPGEEQFHGIFNLHGFSPRNTDLKFVTFLIDVFFKYYPKRLGRVLFIDAPFIFQPGWKIMKPMLKSYANLVVFCSSKDVRETYFLPGQAPESFLKD